MDIRDREERYFHRPMMMLTVALIAAVVVAVAAFVYVALMGRMALAVEVTLWVEKYAIVFPLLLVGVFVRGWMKVYFDA